MKNTTPNYARTLTIRIAGPPPVPSERMSSGCSVYSIMVIYTVSYADAERFRRHISGRDRAYMIRRVNTEKRRATEYAYQDPE